MANRFWFGATEAATGRGPDGWLALTALGMLLGLVTAGCGATAGSLASRSPSPSATSSPPTASTLAELRNRPLNPPAPDANKACPTTSFHSDLSPVINGGKGKGPNYGFGPGPAYLSGTNALYPGGFDNEVWLIEPTYRGPVLVRARQINGAAAISFAEPITFPLGGFSSAGSPPPGPPAATVTIDGAPVPFYLELDLPAATAADAEGYWRMFFARTHIDAPGCYAVQMDGLSFSSVIVFQVPDAARPPA